MICATVVAEFAALQQERGCPADPARRGTTKSQRGSMAETAFFLVFSISIPRTEMHMPAVMLHAAAQSCKGRALKEVAHNSTHLCSL